MNVETGIAPARACGNEAICNRIIARIIGIDFATYDARRCNADLTSAFFAKDTEQAIITAC